jgi:hypothetical protein
VVEGRLSDGLGWLDGNSKMVRGWSSDSFEGCSVMVCSSLVVPSGDSGLS